MSPSGDGSATVDRHCACFSGDNGASSFDGYTDESDHLTCALCGKSAPSSFSACSVSLCRPYVVSLKDWEKLRKIIVASAKGFTIGAGLKGGLAIFSVLARLRRRKQEKSRSLVSNSNAITTVAKETLRYGLFLGTFAGTYVSVDEMIGSIAGHRRTARWRTLAAGAIAGPSMLLTGLDKQHTSLAIYILMRAAVLASRCGMKSKTFGKFCKPLTWSHGEIFIMCLSSAQIFISGRLMNIKLPHFKKIKKSAYILKQESLPASYKSFLIKHGGKEPIILQGIKDITNGVRPTNLKQIEKYYQSMGVNIKLDPDMKVPCSITHGNQSCGEHILSFIFQAYKRAVPVYLPVYLIPALLVHRLGLLKRPYTILGKGLLGTARSSLFLSVYCSSAWMWTCFLFRMVNSCSVPMIILGTFPCGLALVIEKKSRRMEISLYCLARAIECFFTCMADIGYFRQLQKLKRADVLVFSLSTAIIMHCYAQERDVFRSKYLNLLDWVFGVPPPECETPRCKGSSYEQIPRLQ